MIPQSRIRNFCIIAHIDHGKSTLADRILELTRVVSAREAREQYLDRMDLERERGITIKAQTVRIPYTAADGQEYELNLIDTPGHVDFHYEVSRSLAACEGALLVVDATQGVEAPTLANVYLALDHDHEIVPVLNKIDLPSADPARVRAEIEEGIGLDCAGALEVSAKTGLGVDAVLEAIVARLPAPQGDREAPLKALIFDSWYDSYQGVVALFRVMDGRIRKGDRIRLMSTGKEYEALRLGVFSPEAVDVDELLAGEVGFLSGSIKELGDARVGDTITLAARPAAAPVPGFKEVKPVVFCGLYPTESDEYENLKAALEKLQLNDAAFSFEPETSQALGFGFRCGFLGLLHGDHPGTAGTRVRGGAYRHGALGHLPGGDHRRPDPGDRQPEPPARPLEDPRPLRAFRTHGHPCAQRVRGQCHEALRGKARRAERPPLARRQPDYRPSDLVRLDILLNGEPVDALAVIVHRDRAYPYGRGLALKLKRTIPRQLFQVAIQAAIGQKIIARETVSAFRKDVTAKCYGGDITRKRKLLEKQKEGKKRMKRMGNVELPQEAFLAALKVGDE